MLTPPSSNPDDNFAERFRIWRVSQNLTQAEAARQLDIDRSYFSQLERARRLPGNALRTRFFLAEKSSPVKVNGTPLHTHLRNLPVLSWSQAAQMTEFVLPRPEATEFVPTDVADESAFGVRLRGDSMEPRFSDGDIAIVLPKSAPLNGETVIANVRDQGVVCKIIHAQLDKNLVKLSSYNPAYPLTEYTRDEFHWIFPVTVIVKELRRK